MRNETNVTTYMKKLIPFVCAAVALFAAAPVAEARPCDYYRESYSHDRCYQARPRTVTYVSGHDRYGQPILTKKSFVGYNHYGEPVYRYQKIYRPAPRCNDHYQDEYRGERRSSWRDQQSRVSFQMDF